MFFQLYEAASVKLNQLAVRSISPALCSRFNLGADKQANIPCQLLSAAYL